MLKKIEIYGFKSFAEKTILNFDDDINGIVGPNGTGKSNIVDAIKWCLGEQSLKEVRAKTPIDLIFAGSESHPPVNWCEVTITFDNSKKIFPVDYQEIEITRKQYRTGETEYLINRTPCRLKDIKELVIDTGLSPDGYSIIPQGKVEFVISAKPEERRLLFEETAGIAKYKLKREETLRKLERVKLDMARIEDILSYLKEQMSSLEQAVKKAKNYQKYKQELQMLESAYFIQQIEQIELQYKNLEQQYVELETEYNNLAIEITKNDTEIVELDTQISELEKQLLQLRDEKEKIEVEISVLTQKIEKSNSEVENFEHNIYKSLQEIEELNNRNAQYLQEIENNNHKKEELFTKLQEVEKVLATYYNEYELYRKQIEEQQNIVKEKNIEITNIAYNRAKLRNNISEISREIHHCNIEITRINKDVESNKKNIELLNSELKQIEKQISELENKKRQNEEIITQLNTQLEQLQQLLQQKKLVYENKKNEFYSITSKIENLTSNTVFCSYNVQKLLFVLKDTGIYCVPVNSIIKIKPEYQSIISSYLGNKLFWLVVEDEESAFKIIDILKQHKMGYATFIIKNKLDELVNDIVDTTILDKIEYEPQWYNVIKFLLSKVCFVDDKIKSDVLLHGGDKDLTDQQQDLFQLQQLLTKVSTELEEINNEIQQLAQQCDDITNKKLLIEKEQVSIETKLKEFSKIKQDKEGYLSSLIELSSVLNNDIVNFEQKLKSLTEEQNLLNEEVNKLDEQEKQLREEVEKYLANISLLQSNKVVEEYVKVNSEYAHIKEQYNSLIKEIETKQKLVDFNKQKVKMLEEEIETFKISKEDALQNIKDIEEKLSLVLKQKEEIALKIKDCVDNLEKIKNLRNEKEQQNKQLISKKEELQNKLTSVEIEKNSMINNKNNYVHLLKDKYSLELEEAKNLYGNVKEVDLQTIEKLKKKIDAMSAVNLAAPEEYAQLEERYNHLVTQQQDLIKSQQDLKDAIAKINKQISDNFKETFCKVRENFIKLCKILFEGGEADLILTDEENILESGIEIVVQPPGKKLQNINLLSGGEKSLVAFALLFAFFMVKPAPVCILDEADAQLDETNVVRFMRLLKDFSKNTKFIVITHNTRTMEFINTLYGVTMEELGVSKVIAVKLHQVPVSS